MPGYRLVRIAVMLTVAFFAVGFVVLAGAYALGGQPGILVSLVALGAITAAAIWFLRRG